MTKCRTTKKRFRDELSARIALSRMVWRDSGEKRIYECPFCKGFHMTSQEQRTEKAPR